MNPKEIFAYYAGWVRPPDFDGRSRSRWVEWDPCGTTNGVRSAVALAPEVPPPRARALPGCLRPAAREGGREARPPPRARASPRPASASSAMPRSEVPSARADRAARPPPPSRARGRQGGEAASARPRCHAPLRSPGAREGRGRLRLAARTSLRPASAPEPPRGRQGHAHEPPPGRARGR